MKQHPTVKFFTFHPIGEDVKEKIQSVRDNFSGFATIMDTQTPDGQEKSAGMRKLLEAKDAFCRAHVEGALKEKKND